MDYYSLPRKQLQALCKKHGIPANSTNVSMADALTVLLNGVGNIKPFDEKFQKQGPASEDMGDDSVLTDVSNTPRRCKRSKRLVIAEEDDSAEEPVVIEIEETPVAPKRKGAKSANETRERRPGTRARSRKVLDVDIVNIDGCSHSSEVDESSDAVTALNSRKVERCGPVKGSRNARTPRTKSCRLTDENEDLEPLEDKQVSDEKEEKTDQTTGELVQGAPKTRTKGRSSRKKVDNVEAEEAIEDEKEEKTDQTTGKLVQDAPKTRTKGRSSRKKVDKVEAEEAIEDEREEKTDQTTGELFQDAPKTRTKGRSSRKKVDKVEAEEVIEDEREEKTDQTTGELVQDALRTRTEGRSSRKKVDKVEAEEAIEDSSTQRENDASKNEMTPVCRRSTRARASKIVDTHPSQNRSSSIKKTENAKSKIPATVSKARRVKLSPMTENFTDNKEEGDPAEEVVKVSTKKNLLAKPKSSSNNDVKSPVQTRRALRNGQKDSGRILNNDALEESASKVKQVLTRRGRNSVRNAHKVTSSETQEESKSESEGSDAKQEKESSRKFARKATRIFLGKDEHKCTEDIDVPQADLNVKEDEVVENKAPEDVEAIDETESEEMKCEITLQLEPYMCQNFDQKHVSSDISQPESSGQFENKSFAEISSRRSSKDRQSTPISESHGPRTVKELNVYSGEVSMEQGIVSAGMTPLSRSVEGNFDNLPSVDQLGALKIQDSSCLKYSTDSIVAEESPIKMDAFTSSVEARVGELIGIEDGEVGVKMVNDGVNVAESHNRIRSVTMHVDLKREEDAPFSHIVDSLKIEEPKEILHHSDHKMNNFNIEDLQCGRDLSSSSAEAASLVEEKGAVMKDSSHSSIDATQNLFEVQEKVVNVEHGDVAVLALYTSGEECLDPKAVYSSDLKIAGEQTELQLILEETNWITTESNLQDSSFLIDEDENQDAQDSDFSFEVASDISQVQDRDVTGFGNAENQVLKTSEKNESGEDCHDVEEEILSDFDNTEEENQDVQDSDLSFKVVSDIYQVQDREVTGFANAEGQVLKASEKIESGEDCQDLKEEILSDLDDTEVENQDSDHSFKVVSNILQVQNREVTSFAYVQSPDLEASKKVESGEDCQDLKEEIVSDLDDTEVENQDSDHSFKVVSNILQVQNREITGFANVQSPDLEVSKRVESGENLTSLPEETKDSATEEKLDIGRQSFEEESTGLDISKQDQDACNDTVEGKHPCQSSLSDNVSEVEVLVYSNVEDIVIAIQRHGTSDDDRITIDKSSRDGKLVVFNENSASRIICVPLLCTKEETNMQDQISDKQVSPTADLDISVASDCQSVHSIDCLESDMMATMKSFETGKGGKELGVEDTSALPVQKYLPGIATEDSEQINIKESEFAVEASCQVSPTADLDISVASDCQSVHSIDCLESDMMATMKSFETGKGGKELGVEDTSALPVQKYLPGIATEDSEQINIKESEFAVEASCQVSPTADLGISVASDCQSVHSIDCLESDMMATMKSFETGKGGKELGVEDTSALPVQKYLPGIATEDSEQINIKESEFAVEASCQVSPTADLGISVASDCQSVHSIDCLESDMMATMKSFETGKGGKELGVEDTSALPVQKYLPGIATEDSEQINIKESEFAVEASYEGKIPIVVEDTSFHDPRDASCVETLCEKINYMSLDGASEDLSANDLPFPLMKPYPVEKAQNALIKVSRQQSDLTDQSRKDGFQIAPLESAGCELQTEKENHPDPNDLSMRKLRALVKEKIILKNDGQKERERLVLRDLTSIDLEKRNKVPDNTQL